MTQVQEGQDDGELAASPARRLLWVWMGLAGAAAMAAQAEAELRALAVPPPAQLVRAAAPVEERVRRHDTVHRGHPTRMRPQVELNSRPTP